MVQYTEMKFGLFSRSRDERDIESIVKQDSHTVSSICSSKKSSGLVPYRQQET